ncbi:MAG: cation acetate symporter [Coriobacteriales bacterium]|nr:cation acetate symporter [Coriobacteriales bacterium]
MAGVDTIPLMFVVGIVLATIGLGIYATRLSRTASDFYVAGRGVNALWNSSAISGEYLSAASFMGIAGMLMKFGYDVLWYAVGYAAGYVFLLLFIAGPLRRFGAYTIPDFAEGRFDSSGMRKLAVIFALSISFFYMMPQMKGAGITLAQLLKTPYWVGVFVVGTVITLNVILGGMKGITFTQAFQYWVKMFAISIPIFVLMTVFGHYGTQVSTGGSPESVAPPITETATYKFPQAGTLKMTSDGTIVPETDVKAKVNTYDAEGIVVKKEKVAYTGGAPVNLTKGQLVTFATPVKVQLNAGMTMPNYTKSEKWLHPFGPFTSKYVNPADPVSVKWVPLLYTYSLIIALLCGTAGLPHILVRFYTNPDGRSAKRTTLLVIGMLSLFYIFPAMWGSMGRNVIPSLYANGGTDLVTILLPTKLSSPLWGQIFSGITSAGAFAAFMTTFSGLLVSASSAFAHDIYGRILRPEASPESRLKAFKVAAAGVGLAAMSLGLLVQNFDINMLVGWAFAIGASTYFPLLLMGAWWRRLTKSGAVAGMLGGGLAAIGSVLFTMAVDKGWIAQPASGFLNTLLVQPAIWTVPLALGLMVFVSLATQNQVPADIRLKMLKLHAPESLGLKADYITD